jgi:integrase
MDDVDLQRRLIYVRAKTIDGIFWQPKTKRNRVVPMSDALFFILSEYLAKRSGRWFFPSSTGKRWDPDNYSQDLRSIKDLAGLVWSCLDFRHTFGSHLAQKGESLFKIATLLGNSPDICRGHYAALIPEEMHDVVEFARPKMKQDLEQESTNAILKRLVEKLNGPSSGGRENPLRLAQ